MPMLGNGWTMVGVRTADGAPAVSEDLIREYWNRIEQHDLYQLEWFGGGVETFDQFYSFITSPAVAGYLMEDNGKQAGVAWVDGIWTQHAYIHGLFFPEYWGRIDNVVERGMRWIFGLRGYEGKPLFTHLRMRIPATNKPALAFATRLGFSRLGDIPGGAYLAYEHRRVDLVELYRSQ